MIVAASTECFKELSLEETVDKCVDLEYTNIEIDLHEEGGHLRPSEVAADLNGSIDRCLNTRRLNIVSYSVRIPPYCETEYEWFESCCLLARATKVVTMTIQSAELGTPFNEEVERLRELVKIAERHGVRVSLKNEIGCLSEDPDTIKVLCDNVPGLGLTLDPSHFLCGRYANRDYTKLIPYVFHVHLRDSTKDDMTVKIGQGEIEYGRLINFLQKQRYNRALSTNIQPVDDPDIDHHAEMRKMRLLLESLLI